MTRLLESIPTLQWANHFAGESSVRYQLDDCSIEIDPLGDSALRIHLGDQPNRIHDSCKLLLKPSLAGVRDVVTAYETIVVHFDPKQTPNKVLTDWVLRTLEKTPEQTQLLPRVIEIPIVYDGEDLNAIATHSGLSIDEIIDRHVKGSYQVRMIGFMPGFPYLEGLDPSLAMPRRCVPRTKVLAGSVGIGGAQTGIYSFDSPGGWNLLGRTPLRLFDPKKSAPSILQAGDHVRFRPIDTQEFDSFRQRQHSDPQTIPHQNADDLPRFEVMTPGLQTSIQDLGRWGSQAIGVTPGGVMDYESACLANWLVGNHEAMPVLEIALVGPKLKILQDQTVALVGANTDLPVGKPLRLAVGEVIDLKKLKNRALAYLAVEGGFVSDQRLGGSGTDLRARFGGYQGRALFAGDQLFGREMASIQHLKNESNWFVSAGRLVPNEPEGRIRVIRGPQADCFAEATWQTLMSHSFAVGSQSDRMGIRLEGKLPLEHPIDMRSEPTVAGAIQVPPSGSPLVLMADRQTVGGYPVIGVVATVDHSRLAQLRPGDTFRFVEISLAKAEALLDERKQRFDTIKQGIQQSVAPNAARPQRIDMIRPSIDINGDAGEGVGDDEAFIPFLSSVNIACGAHAGDDTSIRRAVQFAVASNVAMGAHPGFADRKNFGRRELPITPLEAYELVVEQIKRVQRIANEFSAPLQHVKPHGALYHLAARQADLAMAIARAVVASEGPQWLLGPSGSELEIAAKKVGLQFATEAFADRKYDQHGNLLSRIEPNGLITDPAEASEQAFSIAVRGEVFAIQHQSIESHTDKIANAKPRADGSSGGIGVGIEAGSIEAGSLESLLVKLPHKATSICLHGDTPGAVAIAKAVRRGLVEANLRVQPFGSC